MTNTRSLHSIAGSETSATSIATITYFLLRSPTAYAKLTTQVRGRFTSLQEIDIASTSASELPYLHAVMDEGMRVVPTASVGFSRNAPEPGVMVDGHFVPAGTELYLSSWTAARDERYFHDPTSFKPERWLDPGNTDTKEASQPFSVGPRSCPGKTFAYAQMSLQLTKMVWAYDMELVDDKLDWAEDVRMHFVLLKP
jgi:cytochrome P450